MARRREIASSSPCEASSLSRPRATDDASARMVLARASVTPMTRRSASAKAFPAAEKNELAALSRLRVAKRPGVRRITGGGDVSRCRVWLKALRDRFHPRRLPRSAAARETQRPNYPARRTSPERPPDDTAGKGEIRRLRRRRKRTSGYFPAWEGGRGRRGGSKRRWLRRRRRIARRNAGRGSKLPDSKLSGQVPCSS